MKPWKSPVPKKRRNEGVDIAVKMIVYPPAIAVGLLFSKQILKKKRKKKKKY